MEARRCTISLILTDSNFRRTRNLLGAVSWHNAAYVKDRTQQLYNAECKMLTKSDTFCIT